MGRVVNIWKILSFRAPRNDTPTSRRNTDISISPDIMKRYESCQEFQFLLVFIHTNTRETNICDLRVCSNIIHENENCDYKSLQSQVFNCFC